MKKTCGSEYEKKIYINRTVSGSGYNWYPSLNASSKFSKSSRSYKEGRLYE